MTQPKIKSLVFVSTETVHLSDEDLLNLLKKARQKNLENGITGMLLHKDGNFMEVIEGEASKVDWLFQSILNDPRHRKIEVIDEKELSQREFGDWSMGFRKLDSNDTPAIHGYNEFMSRPLTSSEFSGDKEGSRALLRLFKSGCLNSRGADN